MDMFTVCIGILAIAIIMMAYINIQQMISKKDDVSQLARQYILKMETVGYLRAEDKTQLIQRLTDTGMTDINLAGTTVTNVGYGNPVVLIIEGKLYMDKLSGGDLFQMVFEKQGFPITEKRMSTAKN